MMATGWLLSSRSRLLVFAAMLLLLVLPGTAQASGRQAPPGAAVDQAPRGVSREEQAKREYELARRQELQDIRRRARRDREAMRHGWSPEAETERQWRAMAERQEAVAVRRRQEEIARAGRKLAEAQCAYQALLDGTKKKTGR